LSAFSEVERACPGDDISTHPYSSNNSKICAETSCNQILARLFLVKSPTKIAAPTIPTVRGPRPTFGFQSMTLMAKYLGGDKTVVPTDKKVIMPTLAITKDKVALSQHCREVARTARASPGIAGGSFETNLSVINSSVTMRKRRTNLANAL
jgi:hypothetical protein